MAVTQSPNPKPVVLSNMTTPPTLRDCIDCARRELALRRRCYPGWVKQSRMDEAKAGHEIACMERIVERLEMLENLRQVSEKLRSET